MITWGRATTAETKPAKPALDTSANLLYRFGVAFPSWAGALLALYTVIVLKLGGLRLRTR